MRDVFGVIDVCNGTKSDFDACFMCSRMSYEVWELDWRGIKTNLSADDFSVSAGILNAVFAVCCILCLILT